MYTVSYHEKASPEEFTPPRIRYHPVRIIEDRGAVVRIANAFEKEEWVSRHLLRNLYDAVLVVSKNTFPDFFREQSLSHNSFIRYSFTIRGHKDIALIGAGRFFELLKDSDIFDSSIIPTLRLMAEEKIIVFYDQEKKCPILETGTLVVHEEQKQGLERLMHKLGLL
jgi:hypothetical protein